MSKINWDEQTAQNIKNLVRGLNPIMGAYTFLDEKKIKFWKVDIAKNIGYDEDNIQIFKNGTVLRAETLNNQNFYSEKIRQYAYSDYPDGIVSGFSLKKNGDFWYLTPGIAKMNDNIYVLDQVSDEEILSLYFLLSHILT